MQNSVRKSFLDRHYRPYFTLKAIKLSLVQKYGVRETKCFRCLNQIIDLTQNVITYLLCWLLIFKSQFIRNWNEKLLENNVLVFLSSTLLI